MPPTFTINWDYRCPFARNANEHVLAALEGGADYDVQFKAFSLSEVHIGEGEPDVWDSPDKRPDLIALAAGVVVRDRFPELFAKAHVSLFAVRHDDGDDLRDEAKVRNGLTRAGVDADAVFAELDKGWPFDVVRDEHVASVEQHAAFGVPTFISGSESVFVRLMTRPAGDGKLARETVDRVLELVVGHPELNEYKHTSIPR
jgi:DSBA-like thioredoxin domain